MNNRPVQYNTTVKFEGIPEGHMGEGYMATSLEKVVGLARKNSIWPLPFATSCCGIEFMATMASHYDLARFGSERVGYDNAIDCRLAQTLKCGVRKNRMRPSCNNQFCPR